MLDVYRHVLSDISHIGLSLRVSIQDCYEVNNNRIASKDRIIINKKICFSMLRNSWTDRWKPKHWAIIGIVVYVAYIGTFVTVNILAFIPQEWTRWLYYLFIFLLLFNKHFSANAPSELLEIYGMDLSNPNAGFESIVARVSPFGYECAIIYWMN